MDQFSHDPFGSSAAADDSSQRYAPRDSLLLTAQLRLDGGAASQVRVRNLSAGGLMAEYAQIVSSGTCVEVEVRGVGMITGRIAWCAEGRVGIAFDRPIDPKLARKPVGQGSHTPNYARSTITRG